MAGRIAEQSVESVLRASDIVSVVQGYGVRLRGSGSSYMGCCPFHSEKTPSFSVSPDKNLYYCFGCRAGGNVISFVREMEKCSFTEAVEILAKKAGIALRYEEGAPVEDEGARLRKEYTELYTRMAGTFHFLLTRTEQGAFALAYLRSRGISDATAEKFNLGYSPADRAWLRSFLEEKSFSAAFLDGSGLFTRRNPRAALFADRLMFPICDRNGSTVAFGGRWLDRGIPLREGAQKPPKYMNSGDLVQFQKGETLFAFHLAKSAIRRERRVVFCEGYMDCIAYHQCGVEYAVAPLGTALTEAQLRLVSAGLDEAFLSFDSDGAGQAATRKAVLLCRSKGIPARVIRLRGGKDPAEIMQKFGAAFLVEAVEGAVPDFDWLASSLFEANGGGSPESLSRVEAGLFEYADALGSEVERESVLSRIAGRLGIREEAVRTDFANRGRLEERIASYSVLRGIRDAQSAGISLDAEIRAVFSVVANLSLFPIMGAELTEADFENPLARLLFGVLSECAREGSLSLGVLQGKVGNDELWRMLTESVVRGEFAENAEQSVRDSVKTLRLRSLSRRRDLLQRMIQDVQSRPHDGEELMVLIEEKMGIDQLLNRR